MHRTFLRHCRKRTNGAIDAKWLNKFGKCNVKFRPRVEINRQFFIYSPVIVNRRQQFKLCFRLMTLSG